MSNFINYLTTRVSIATDLVDLVKSIVRYYRYASEAERQVLINSDMIVCRNNISGQAVAIEIKKAAKNQIKSTEFH